MARKVNINIPGPGSFVPQIKLYGQWQRAVNQVNGLAPAIQRGYDEATLKFSRRLLRIVKEAIATGTPPKGSGVYWEPLSPATIKRYKNQYPGHHLYYLSGLYYRSVGFFHYKNRTMVGLPINKKRSSQGGLTLNQLAKILEFGTGGMGGGKQGGTIPARPLWAPSFKAAGGMGELKREILKSLRTQLYKLGFKANQVKW